MYQLKSVARRLALLLPVAGILGAVSYQAIMPSISMADALNPLTKRSLLLTSSSPGWAYTDGSGDSTYAPPGSGPNGQKTGETFTFDTSTDSSSTPVKAFSLQYCTTAAGTCLAPGNDSEEPSVVRAGSAPYYADDSSHTDFNVVEGGNATTSYPIGTPGTGWSEGGSVVSNVPTTTAGDFAVYENVSGTTWTYESGWSMKEANVEDTGATTTGANNYIQLLNSTGITPNSGEEIEIQFQPNGSNYITNPGSEAFFVKINDYNGTTDDNFADNNPYDDVCGGGSSDCPADVTDGGVTVAQVMNQSIEIQTKVLETMDFSVGTVDPDTLTTTELNTDTDGNEPAHGQCNPILPYDAGNVTNTPANPSADTLLLGNPTAEYSLATNHAYDTNSLFRVSTNAANGATVYYSGETLSDTEGNQIQPMVDNPGTDDSAYAETGTEQFGLGLEYAPTTITNAAEQYLGVDNESTPGNIATAQSDEVPYTASLDGPSGTAGTFLADLSTNSSSPYWYTPTLSPLLPTPSYGDANGTLASGSGPKFAFNAHADTVPVPIATEDVQVVNCATGDVRYVADIASSTPAGIYTTAINYLAAPEY